MAMLPTDYKELTRTILNDAAAKGIPANGTFELTSRCNLACAMCYIRTRAGDRAMKASELTADQWVALAKEGVDAGMMFLLLTGGEVFLRPDFFDIYEPLTDMGLLLTLFTNSTLITRPIAQRLARRPPNRTEITIYGATQPVFEAVTGQPGSYARAMRGIQNLLDAGVQPKIKTTLSRLNAHEFEEMQAMAEQWGSSLSASWLLTKRRDFCNSSIEEIRFSAGEAVAMESRDPVAVENLRKIAESEEALATHEPFYCHAGKCSFVIGPSGDMNVCIDLCLPRARPTEIGFVAAWDQVKRFIHTVPEAADCAGCDLNAYCSRCPAWAYIESGSMTSSVVYLCDIAKERKQRATAAVK